MRVLFVNEKCGWFGGVEQNIADTVTGLRERGAECFLAWGEETKRAPREYAALFNGAMCCKELLGEGESLARIIEQIAPDCLYFHKISRMPQRSAFPDSLRVVRMVHDHELCCPRRHKYFFHNAHICNHPAGWRCWADLAFLRKDSSGLHLHGLGAQFAEMRNNRNLDLLLVGSRFMRDELTMNGFPEPRVQILAPVVRLRSAEVTDCADAPHVLFVGQLIRGKGVDLLLQALAKLRCDYTATIVGDGNAREGLEALHRELGLGDRVRFAGWVANDCLSEYYAAARVLAVPARWPEPFGMIGLEAMQHARPVVAFRAGGIPDWLEDGKSGILVAERDVEGYARALERLLTDRSLATGMGRAGLERVRTHYSFDGYLDRLLQYLKGAAS